MNKYIFRAGAACLALLLGCQAYAQPSVLGCPDPATGAFTGCYYSNQTLSGEPALIRTDSQINFDWANGSPDPSLQPDNFSAQWQGIFPFSASTYTFSVIASDGIRIYVDGNDVLDVWRDRSPTYYTISQPMSSGTHLITVQYYEKSGGATAQVSWVSTSPGVPAPLISSFAAQPSSTAPNQPVTLSWATSGATSLSINNGVGDVTSQTSAVVYPTGTTTYVLTASNASGSTTANATVTVAAAPDTQPPTTPTLLSAVAKSASEVDLLWTASSDNTAVTGYQVLRNGVVVSSVPAASLIYVDTTVAAGVTYTYAVAAYDAAGNISAPSSPLQVTTPAAAPVVTSGACPGPATNAFTGCYYNNTTLAGNPVLVRTDNQLNFDWGNHSPDPSVTPLNFSATWQGQFTFAAGTYTFSIITSDGMRISLDGNLIFDEWRDQSPMFFTLTQTIAAGTHLISVQYYEKTGGATAQVSWTGTAATAPPPGGAPVISSFTSTPSASSAGQPVTLSWAVSGASSLSIDQSVGDVTGKASITVTPSATTTYTLTASSASGSTASATVTVTVSAPSGGGGGGGGTIVAPTTPTLVSAIATSATEVDLTWTASSSPAGIASYQILRNGYPLGSVSGSTLTYADTSTLTSSTYAYTIKAYDPAGNYSAPSNAIQVTTPASSGISVTWYGPCWYTGTVNGITGNFQAIDFNLTTPTPVPLQGTLFAGADCTASGGDNLNDLNATIPSVHLLDFFTHNVNVSPTSAIYWIGDRTADGRCPPGSTLCSGCVNYNSATLSCSVMP